MDTDHKKRIIHLISNAHLDPVWLWDWREGLTEAVSTTRTILDLMDKNTSLTFVRGEAFLYRHIECVDPGLFQRLLQRIEEGRWDVVGGTMVQSDMNMPATETMARQLLYAQRYFMEHFGRRARVGWSADCFGHSAALPDVLAAGGIEYYVYTRPSNVPTFNLFWWEGPSGIRLLTYHPPVGCGYYTERDEIIPRLNRLVSHAAHLPYQNIICFIGLGNHGGHPTQRMLDDIRVWAETHPDVRVEYSTLSRYFDCLAGEASSSIAGQIPVFRGELNPTPRGIYVSAARFKFAYRKAEASVNRAERIAAVVAATTETKPFVLNEAWEALLFNCFHDIMPGSCIERAFDEQFDWLSLAPHAARMAEQRAIAFLAGRIDTRVKPAAFDMPAAVPFLAFNPHPWPYNGYLELEACLDYRPIWKYCGRLADLPLVVRSPAQAAIPLQKIECEHLFAADINFRNRVLVPVHLPSYGWNVLEFAYEEGATVVPVENPVSAGLNSISNELWTVAASKGDRGIAIYHDGKSVLAAPGLTAITVEDPWGSWGDFQESAAATSLEEIRDHWTVVQVAVGECGPLRSTLHVQMQGGNSRFELCFALTRGRDAVDVGARVFWDERSAHLKLLLPGGFTAATYDILGGTVRRTSAGEVPGGRWVQAEGARGNLGFASDALYGFNLTRTGDLQVSIARATRYASAARAGTDEYPWRPILDCGELRFQFLLATEKLQHLAYELEQPPLLAHVTPSPGHLDRQGSLLALDSDMVRLLALKPDELGQGWILRLQSFAPFPINPGLAWLGQSLSLPELLPNKLTTVRLRRTENGQWTATLCHLLEAEP